MIRKLIVCLLLSIWILAVIGCSPSSDGEDASVVGPQPIEHAEDAVCGMLVRDQPAPRAQIVHRDGTRAYFCSIGDLMAQLSAPSPHGKVKQTFVEVLEPDEDPMQRSTSPHAWVSADQAVFVTGVPRPGIMGAPVLAYRDEQSAAATLSRWPDARATDMAGLLTWWNETISAR